MAGIFSIDSKFTQFLSRLWDMFLLNILFLVGCIPIVTAGASAIAAYDVALRIVEDTDSGIVVPFFKAYKENIRQGIVLTIVHDVFALGVILDFIMFEASEDPPIFLLIVGILAAVLVHVHFFYVYALTARYSNNLFRHLSNSRKIFVRFIGKSFVCTVLTAAEIWLFFFNGWLLIFIGVFIAPILIIMTTSAIALPVFRKIEKEGGVITESESSAEDGVSEENDSPAESDDAKTKDSPIENDPVDNINPHKGEDFL